VVVVVVGIGAGVGTGVGTGIGTGIGTGVGIGVGIGAGKNVRYPVSGSIVVVPTPLALIMFIVSIAF
jgi:hypothetical protein